MIHEMFISTQNKSISEGSQNIVEYTKPHFSKQSDWKIRYISCKKKYKRHFSST